MPNTPELFDVFLSCRGDILETHAVPLYLALRRAKLHTFFYLDRRNPGGRIVEKIQDGVKHSASAIIIFSKDYATSNWCLDELLLILDRVKTSYFPLIPIYCDGVSYKMFEEGGIYQEALENHKKKFTEEKVKKWSEALKELEGREYKRAKGSKLELDKFFEEIADEIREKIATPNVKVPVNIPKRRWRNFTRRILRIDREERTAATRHPGGINSAAVQPPFEEITENDHEQQELRAINVEPIVNKHPTNRKGKEVMDPCFQEINESVDHSSPTNEKNDPKRRLQNFIRKIIVKNNREKEIKKLTIHQGGTVPMKITPDPAGMIPMNVTQHPARRILVARQTKGSHSEETRENYLKQREYQAISTVEPIVNRGSTSRQGKEVMGPCFDEINNGVHEQQEQEASPTYMKKESSIHPRRRLQNYIRKIIKNNRAKKTPIPNVTLHPGRTEPLARRTHSKQIDEHDDQANPAIFVNGGPSNYPSRKRTLGFEEIISEIANEQQVGNQSHQSSLINSEENEEKLSVSDSSSSTKDEVRKKSCFWSCGLGPLCVYILTAHRNFVDNLIRKLTGE